jgi:hypothetical protein
MAKYNVVGPGARTRWPFEPEFLRLFIEDDWESIICGELRQAIAATSSGGNRPKMHPGHYLLLRLVGRRCVYPTVALDRLPHFDAFSRGFPS